MDKVSLRQLLLSRLNSLPNDEIQRLSFELTNQILKFFSSVPELTGQVGGGYLPLRAEIAPVYQELLLKFPVALAFPVLIEGEMGFGIPQGMPRGNTWLDQPYHVVEPDWLFVPGVAFDLKGARLGRGKGYYDRFLEEKDCLTVALAWSEQIVEKVPVEKHDIHMDFIITEKYCWDVNQQEKF